MPSFTVASTSKAPLLDDEDGLSAPFEAVLEAVFRQFAPAAQQTTSGSPTDLAPLKDLSLSRKELNAFSVATNGQPMTDETFEEICEYFSLADDSAEGDARALTFRGFYELYAMQTGAEEEETWKDLKAWGYDEQLRRKVEEVQEEGKEAEAKEKSDA